MLREFIEQFTQKEILDFSKVVQIEKRYYLVEDEVTPLIKKGAVYAGIFLGEEKGKRFKPSFILLERILPCTEQKILVDEKVGWLFVCGRDVLGLSEHPIAPGTPLLVCSKRYEILGFGVADRKIGVKNLLDRGDFLRRER